MHGTTWNFESGIATDQLLKRKFARFKKTIAFQQDTSEQSYGGGVIMWILFLMPSGIMDIQCVLFG